MDYEQKYKDALKRASGFSTQECRDVAEYIFPELVESLDEKIRKGIKSTLEHYKESGEVVCPYPFVSIDEALAWLEKQGKQNPTDKVEPKFKVGDWVVTSYGKVNQVVSVDKDGDGYTLDDDVYFSGSWCDMYHLWTIQDAKDGDVLAAELKNIHLHLWLYTKNKMKKILTHIVLLDLMANFMKVKMVILWKIFIQQLKNSMTYYFRR